VGRSISIGTIRGIAIKVHPSFALVIVWVIYQWGVAAHAGLSGMLFGTLVLGAVFACVLAHEVAHAVVARRYGLEVHDITLLPIGGVARVEYAALSPRAESMIALAGPAMNIAIALALTPLVLVVAAIRHLAEPIGIVLYAGEISPAGFILYLWIANVLLAAFNMLPAFPMDGGRVLRAVLTLVADRLRATRIAVVIGQVFAVLLAILGLWIGDYLLPMVSLFILIAAQTESRYVQIESSLRALPVGQFALWESGGIRPDAPLAHAINGGPRDMAVTQGGKVVGMLWRHDVIRHIGANDRMVKDVMDKRVLAVDIADSVYDVHLWLAAINRPAVPVVEHGVYRGIFTGERLEHIYEHVGDRTQRWQRQVLLACITRLKVVWR
jgi:Zn-dependent protease